jgi:hypothetical protein
MLIVKYHLRGRHHVQVWMQHSEEKENNQSEKEIDRKIKQHFSREITPAATVKLTELFITHYLSL